MCTHRQQDLPLRVSGTKGSTYFSSHLRMIACPMRLIALDCIILTDFNVWYEVQIMNLLVTQAIHSITCT
jgi:hypothetical protein